MICNWGKKEFLKQRDTLVKLIEEEKDPIKKDYLNTVLNSVNSLIMETFEPTPSYRSCKNNYICNVVGSVTLANSYYSILSDYYYGLEGMIQDMENIHALLAKRIKSKYSLNELGDSRTTPRMAYRYVRDFYKQLDPDLYRWFMEVEKNSFVSFPSKNCSTLDSDSDGESFYIDGVKANFITVRNSRDARMYHNLVHEYGHAIKNMVDPVSAYTNENDYFAELPSIFPELLALESNVPNYPQIIVDYLKYSTFLDYFNDAYYLNTHQYIKHQLQGSNFKSTLPFYYRLYKEEGITPNDFSTAIKKDIVSDGAYVLSYIAALELLHIYRKDKKKALELFKELLRIAPSSHYLGDVSSIIPLNVNAREESERVVKTLSRSLRK